MLKVKVTKEIDVQDIYDEADADIDLYEEEELEGEEIPYEEYYPECVERAMDYYIREYRAEDEYQLSDLIVENYATIKKFILDKLYKNKARKEKEITGGKKFNPIQFVKDVDQIFGSVEEQLAKCKDPYEVRDVLAEIVKNQYTVESINKSSSNEYEYILVGSAQDTYPGISVYYDLVSKEVDFGYLSKKEIAELI